MNLLKQHLLEQGDNLVLHMKPYQLADAWGEERNEVLTMFLRATKIGILIQQWNLMCPNCRVPKASTNSMRGIKNSVHCDLCGVQFAMNFDQYVEMRFSVHPSIRKAMDHAYCIGGPTITPHILAQYRIPVGETKVMQYPDNDHPLRIRILKKNDQIPIPVNHSMPSATPLIYKETGFDFNQQWHSSSAHEIAIQNRCEEEIVVAIEDTVWDDQAVTAAKVTSFQDFRDLFSSEVLSPDQQIGIENITILFSDLKESTKLYETIGDASAYNQVHLHFDYLKKWLSASSGAIVKTIGDSVMAIFYLPENALQAALDIQTHLNDLNKSDEDELVIKIGLFSGPAIAVNANDLLDYFGRTVNIAARIQQASEGNDIVIDQHLYQSDEVQRLLTSYTLDVSPFRRRLSGIQESVDLIQLRNIQEISPFGATAASQSASATKP